MVDASTPLGGIFASLLKEIQGKQAPMNLWESHYLNEAAIPTLAVRSVRESYKRLTAMGRWGFAELIVEAVRERQSWSGFRTAASDQLGDEAAMRIVKANSLDADQALVHRDKLSMSQSFVIVGPVDEETGEPRITIEDPRTMGFIGTPGAWRRGRAALKVNCEDGYDEAFLFLRGEVAGTRTGVVQRLVREGAATQRGIAEADSWRVQGDFLELPVQMPVTKFANRADTRGVGRPEFAGVIPNLNGINYQIVQRLEIATMQAFRQRGIKGDLPQRDAEGNEIDYDDIFSADPGALWQLGATADVWESGVVDLTPIRMAISDDIKNVAAISRTPIYYLQPIDNGSAEGAEQAEKGLVFKVRDRDAEDGESWEQVMSNAFLMKGDAARADRVAIQVLWDDPRMPGMAERYDAATKAIAAQVPWETVMTDVLGFAPGKVLEMQAQRAGDLLTTAAFAPAQPNAV